MLEKITIPGAAAPLLARIRAGYARAAPVRQKISVSRNQIPDLTPKRPAIM